MGRERSLRLRTRVTLFFALIALFAGSVLIGVTYGFARNNLLNRQIDEARTQTFANAQLVRDQLTREPEQIGTFMRDELRVEDGGFATFGSPDQPGASSENLVGLEDLDLTTYPPRLVQMVGEGGNGFEFARIGGEDYIVVGMYIGAHDTGYFEAFPLDDTERTLRAILTALALGGVGTMALATLFGFSTSRRLLRPISRVADAAEEIASGGLDTRLEAESDPDLDRLAASFNDMADAMQTRIEREARFASDVSHELRSPITALAAAVEVLNARREDLPERTRQAVDVVVDQVRRFDSMVIDLLELSRLDAGATDLNVERVDLLDITRRIAARYGEPDLPIECKPNTPRHVVIDKVRFERILGNLVENARNHGGGALAIGLAPARDHRFRILVVDGGPGVAHGERDRIFERFARGSAARHRIGTGLGLALVAEHSAAMGGAAWVEDRPSGGARFVVELPQEVRA